MLVGTFAMGASLLHGSNMELEFILLSLKVSNVLSLHTRCANNQRFILAQGLSPRESF